MFRAFPYLIAMLFICASSVASDGEVFCNLFNFLSEGKTANEQHFDSVLRQPEETVVENGGLIPKDAHLKTRFIFNTEASGFQDAATVSSRMRKAKEAVLEGSGKAKVFEGREKILSVLTEIENFRTGAKDLPEEFYKRDPKQTEFSHWIDPYMKHFAGGSGTLIGGVMMATLQPLTFVVGGVVSIASVGGWIYSAWGGNRVTPTFAKVENEISRAIGEKEPRSVHWGVTLMNSHGRVGELTDLSLGWDEKRAPFILMTQNTDWSLIRPEDQSDQPAVPERVPRNPKLDEIIDHILKDPRN